MTLYLGAQNAFIPFHGEDTGSKGCLGCLFRNFRPVFIQNPQYRGYWTIYVIANNGFIEGRQNEPLMQIMENFCNRSGIEWCGGLGIGGGVMMNVMRIMITVFFGITVLNVVLSGIGGDGFLTADPWIQFGKQALEVLIFGCGIITFDLWLAYCISRQKKYGKHYTRIMVPSFVFIIFADIFFTIVSLLQGGIFRGWFARKK